MLPKFHSFPDFLLWSLFWTAKIALVIFIWEVFKDRNKKPFMRPDSCRSPREDD